MIKATYAFDVVGRGTNNWSAYMLCMRPFAHGSNLVVVFLSVLIWKIVFILSVIVLTKFVWLSLRMVGNILRPRY